MRAVLTVYTNALILFQTRPKPYGQVVFIQASKEGKTPVPVVFALLSNKVSTVEDDRRLFL
jgi:hypothetical protein